MDHPTADPIAAFETLLALASVDAPFDHTVTALATADERGRPSVRMVLLHGFDARGFVFFTNYESRKALDLASNARGALAFYWPWLDQQVRAEGAIERITAEESDAYFATRPRGKQIGAWASDQSRPLSSRADLETRCAAVELRFAGRDVPRPPFWGGFRLIPDSMEFWKAGPDRLHDRFLYRKEGGAWRAERLYP
jgi:pyridoxamine 5'-phosphate oxidase